MSEDMSNKIQQIAELLGQESMPDNVKSLLSMLTGSLSNKEEGKDSEVQEVQEAPVKEEKPVTAQTDDNADMLRKIRTIANGLGAGNDPRINLLHAIRPFMNNNRQKKINNCIQLLQMSSLTKLMDNQEK